MDKFSTAAAKPSDLAALRDPQAGTPGLLNVLQRVRLRGPRSPVAQRTQVRVFATSLTRTYASPRLPAAHFNIFTL